MANTRITYAGAGNDHHEASVLAGELSPGQIRRLELGSFYGKLTALTDELGLARLSHNGNGIRLVTIVPTLEPATNARVDAARFYLRVFAAFARASYRPGQLGDRSEKVIGDRLRGKAPSEMLSTKKALLAMESDQASVASWLRSFVADFVTAAAMLAPLNLDIPQPPQWARDQALSINNVHSIYLMPAAWPGVMGADPAGQNLQNVMTPTAQVTVAQAQAAMEAAKRFSAATGALIARLPA